MPLFCLALLLCRALSTRLLTALFPVGHGYGIFQARCCDARCRVLCPAVPACGSAVSGGCGA
eukprot:4554834-Alexandrium_andersonii.AAC.1